MPTQILDCAVPVTAELVKQIKQSGYAGLGRYLNPNSFKTMVQTEKQIIIDGGLYIVSIWEGNPTVRTYFTFAQGVSDAQNAVKAAQALGQPPGTAIYLTCDYPAQKSDYSAIQDYINGALQHIGPYELGFYGDFDVLSVIQGVKYKMQTVAWSHGEVFQGTDLYQRTTDVTLFGHSFDVDDVISNPGWWPTPKESTMQKFDAVKALVNGSPVKAVGVFEARTEVTHLIWTVARDTGCNLTKVEVDDVEIDGKKPGQVFDGTDTYLRWSDIPSLDPRPEPLPGGGFNFLTRDTHPKPLPQPTPAPQPAPAPTPAPQPEPAPQPQPEPAPAPAPAPVVTDELELVDTISGDILNDAFYFVPQSPQGGIGHFILDTGAFELLINKTSADSLGLPNLGATQVNGVGGSAEAYNSQIDIVVGGVTYKDQPCVVDAGFSASLGQPADGLFGLRFFIDNHLVPELDTDNHVLKVFKHKGATA